MDHVHSPRHGQSLPREDLRQGFVQQESHQSEQYDEGVSDYIQEAVHLASFQDTSNSISGCSYRPQDVSNHRLGLVGECMLLEWYKPQRSTVLPEQKVFGKHNRLKLAPKKQAIVDSGMRIHQFTLGRSQSQQPFIYLC